MPKEIEMWIKIWCERDKKKSKRVEIRKLSKKMLER